MRCHKWETAVEPHFKPKLYKRIRVSSPSDCPTTRESYATASLPNELLYRFICMIDQPGAYMYMYTPLATYTHLIRAERK